MIRYEHPLNERVRTFATALVAGDLARCGALIDASHASLREASGVALSTANHLESGWAETPTRGPWLHEASARRFALTLGRTLALALLIEHADWALASDRDGSSAEAARRYARSGVDLLCDAPRPSLATTGLALGDPLDPALL